jgi:DNA polymerase-4
MILAAIKLPRSKKDGLAWFPSQGILDEAYLDVSENKTGLPTATQVARTIRQQIHAELSLTASAGVAPNKFLAKIASDWKKPNGLFVIQPEEVESFLLPLPVGRLPGVGKVMEES